MLSLYIHIPFCIHKCSYCDFYSIGVGQRAIPDELYVQRVCEELRAVVAEHGLQNRELCSIFFGGGTPSMVRPDLLRNIVNEARSLFQLSPLRRANACAVGDNNEVSTHDERRTTNELEITCEANPETLTPERLGGMLEAGITRLSIGVQSFHARHLEFMERVHSAERAIQAVEDAKCAGFCNINIDIIFGQPDQSTAERETDLVQALALETQHIAAYQLTVEERTPLAAQVQRGAVVPLADDAQLEAWLHIRERLQTAGYEAYEVSNYARPGFRCEHNQHYWRGGDYLGIGTGAVSRIGNKRWRRARNLKRYLAGELYIDEVETLTNEQRYFEHAMLGLRTTEGVDRTNFDAHYPGAALEWIAQGWATSGDRLSMTPKGLSQLESLLVSL